MEQIVDLSAYSDSSEEEEEDSEHEIEFIGWTGNGSHDNSVVLEDAPVPGVEEEMRRLLKSQHAFCEHRDACRRWMLDYLESGKGLADSASSWLAARETTWRCMECFDGYFEIKEDLFSDPVYRERFAGRVEAFDMHRVVSTMQGCLQRITISQALSADDEQDLSYCLYEVLKDVTLLLQHSKLYDLLSQVITRLQLHLEESTMKKRLLPGVLLLLADHDDAVRIWAVRHESTIRVRPEDFPHIVPVFRRWYKKLEGVYVSAEQAAEAVEGVAGLTVEQCWMGVQGTLAHLEDPDRIAPLVVDQFPSLTDIIFSHVTDVVDRQPVLNLHPDVPCIIYQCVGLAFDKLKAHCWSSPGDECSYPPSSIVRGLAQLIGQGRHLEDHLLRPLVDALAPLLRSLPTLQESELELFAAVARQVLEVCISVHDATHQIERQVMVKRACAEIIECVYQGRSNAAAARWPTAGAAKWGTLLVRELVAKVGWNGATGLLFKEVNEAGIRALCCCLEAISAHVVDLMVDTLVVAPPRARPALQRDLLCHDLFKLLVALPFTRLSPILRDAIFATQADLWMVPTKESLFAHTTVKPLNQAAHSRAVAFAGFVRGQLDVNPLCQAAATLAPCLLPLLMIDDDELRRVLQVFMAERTDKSKDVVTLKDAMAVLLRRAGPAVFKGLDKITNDMAILADESFHPFFAYWARLFVLLRTALDAADTSSPEYQERVRRLWSQVAHLMLAALREGRTRHVRAAQYLKTYSELFKLMRQMLPAACVEELRGAKWLGLVLDWVENPVPHHELRHEALEVVQAAIKTIHKNKSVLDGSVWTRLVGLSRKEDVPVELRKAIETFTNSTIVSLRDVSMEGGAPQAERRGAGASAPERRPLERLDRAGGALSNMAGRRDGRAALSRAPIVVRPVRAQEEVEMFTHLRDLQKAAVEHAREMHGHLLRWCLRDVLQSEERRNKGAEGERGRYARVPVRFVDELHYIEVFEPLLLEEARCSLGKELMERGAATSRGGQQQHRPRAGSERFLMKPHSKVLEREGEGGGLFTLSFSMDWMCFNDLRQQGQLGGDDVFVIRPRGKKDGVSLEEGEVSDEELAGIQERRGGQELEEASPVLDWQMEARQPHLLAVVMEEPKVQVGQRWAGPDTQNELQLIRFRAWLPASGDAVYTSLGDDSMTPAMRVMMDHRSFRADTEWVGAHVGSLTTSLREFAALRTVQSIRLAGRLIQGGRQKVSSSALQAVTREQLVQMWGPLNQLCKRCVEGSRPDDPLLINAVRGLKKLKKVRVTATLLKDSGVLAMLKDLKKTHWSKSLQETCTEVIQSWKQQVEAERSCYVLQASDAAPAQRLSSTDTTVAAPTASPTREVAPAPEEPVKCPVQVPSKLWEKLVGDYNPPQLRAISAACNTNTKSFRKSGEITLLQGPPGTGKTRTILGLLSAILHLSADRGGVISGAQKGSGGGNVRPAVRYSGSPCNSRILVCAPSNGAVDVIIHRLMSDGLVDAEGKAFRPPIVRLGNTDALTSGDLVQAATLDSQVNAKVSKSMELQAFKLAEEETHKLRAQIRTLDGGGTLPDSDGHTAGAAKDEATPANRAGLRRQLKAQMGNASRRRLDALRALENLRSRLRMELIRDARIVCSTLSTSAANTLNDAVAAIGQGYGTVVVDEAGQAVEPATIIPLRYGCRNLILVGDPRQLPATVMSELVKSHGYDLSLFERLEKGGHPVHMLTVQYRMHPQIRQFPSTRFYGGKLRDAPHLCGLGGGTDATPVAMPYHAEPCFSPYVVYHVSSGRETKTKRSYSNPIEARFACDLFRRLLADYPTLTVYERVAVITPYKSQVWTLRQEFNKYAPKGWEKLVEISTVDGFQGREKDVIIFSCVRTGRGVGFLVDERRMNVALTRAKHALFVLCNAETLSQNGSWAALMEDAKERRCLVHTRDEDFEQVRRMLKDRRSGEWAGNIRIVRHRDPLPLPPPPSGADQASSSSRRREGRALGAGRAEGGQPRDRDRDRDDRRGGSSSASGPMPMPMPMPPLSLRPQGAAPGALAASSGVPGAPRGKRPGDQAQGGGPSQQAPQRRRVAHAPSEADGGAAATDAKAGTVLTPPPVPWLGSSGRSSPSQLHPPLPVTQPTSSRSSMPLRPPSSGPPPRPPALPLQSSMSSTFSSPPLAQPRLTVHQPRGAAMPPRPSLPPRPPPPTPPSTDQGRKSDKSSRREATGASPSGSSRTPPTDGSGGSSSGTRRPHSSSSAAGSGHKRPRSNHVSAHAVPPLPPVQPKPPAVMRPVVLAGGLPPRPSFAPRPSRPPSPPSPPPARPANPNIISASRGGARSQSSNDRR